MDQGRFTINGRGRVKAPPTSDDVLALIADAVIRKQPVTLKPGEVRVLHDWLVLLEQANPEKLIRSV